ncbi:MAG: hypothetical protein JST65_17345 [Acidobacteria bacterium]|nr:hypothetical protein [Acidobacteriota bacterium]
MRRLLLRLYPKPWRDRYGEEFLALLEDMGTRPGAADVATIVVEAVRARVKYRRGHHLSPAAAVDTPAHATTPPVLADAAFESPVLEWIPLLACLLAAVVAAVAACPVPREVRITGPEAIGYAALYMLGILAAGILSYQVARIATEVQTMPGLRLFAALVWIAPLVAFHHRNSGWTVVVALLFAGVVGRLVLACRRPGERTSGMLFAFVVAVCVDLAIVCSVAGAFGYAGMFAGMALAMLTWRLAPSRPRPVGALRALAYTALAFALTCASFTPYLLAGGDPDGSLLQTWFGEPGSASPVAGKAKGSSNSSARRLRAVTLVRGDPKSGFVLRPPVDEDKPLVPPPPAVTKRLFGKTQQAKPQRVDPFEIPFDGVYWFYPAFRITIPPDAGEREGDPVENGFHSNDGTPMVMEARQNIGHRIDLRGYRDVEIVVRNADPRPGTVWMQLLVRDTHESRWKQQWIGSEPVMESTKGDQPAVRETLRFRIPPALKWPEFDEVIVRFDLRWPRRVHSAKISIERFRFLPRGI